MIAEAVAVRKAKTDVLLGKTVAVLSPEVTRLELDIQHVESAAVNVPCTVLLVAGKNKHTALFNAVYFIARHVYAAAGKHLGNFKSQMTVISEGSVAGFNHDLPHFEKNTSVCSFNTPYVRNHMQDRLTVI